MYCWVNVFKEIGDICSYSAVVTSIEKIIALGINIASGFERICFGIATIWAREVPKIIILLLEVTQAGRNKSYVFCVSIECHVIIISILLTEVNQFKNFAKNSNLTFAIIQANTTTPPATIHFH